ncbi:MAG: hypothetical protein HUU60_12195 [Armatimonadetes bacterium]|nr:hypothetical protein [Armatimonadota bacterium]
MSLKVIENGRTVDVSTANPLPVRQQVSTALAFDDVDVVITNGTATGATGDLTPISPYSNEILLIVANATGQDATIALEVKESGLYGSTYYAVIAQFVVPNAQNRAVRIAGWLIGSTLRIQVSVPTAVGSDKHIYVRARKAT